MRHYRREIRMVAMRRLDAAHARVLRRVRILQIVDVVVGRHVARAIDKTVGAITQALDLGRRQQARQDDVAVPVVNFHLRAIEHLIQILEAHRAP